MIKDVCSIYESRNIALFHFHGTIYPKLKYTASLKVFVESPNSIQEHISSFASIVSGTHHL